MAFGTPAKLGSTPSYSRTGPRTNRTTAGSARIPTPRGGVRGMGAARPVTDIPFVMANLSRTTAELPDSMIRPLAEAARQEYDRQGSRYRLRGATGGRVPLGARTEAAKGSQGRSKRSRWVVGAPAGFWRIVEEGSKGHLIAGRYRKSGRRFTARGATNAFLRNAERGNDSFNMGSPINVLGGKKGDRAGWAQYARHPGHGPIGRPWRRATIKAPKIVGEVQEAYARNELVRAFFR